MVPIIAILGGIILALVTVCVVLVLHQKNKESEYRMSIQLISDDYESKKVAMQQDYSKQMQQMQQHYLNQIQRLQDEKVVLCKQYENRIRQTQEDIDEYPYIARASKSLASTLQLLIADPVRTTTMPTFNEYSL